MDKFNIDQTFNGIAGYDAIKRDAYELVDMLNNESKYVDLGARLPRGYLIYGNVGVGKTLIARSILKAVSRPVFEISFAESKRKGMELKALVVDVFEKVKQNPHSIVFIDELDKVADEETSVFVPKKPNEISTILLDCVESAESQGGLVIATANRLRGMSVALVRSGRFDRQINMHNPNLSDCRLIFKHYLGKNGLAKGLDLDCVIKSLVGLSCADIECIANEAVIHRISEGRDFVNENDITIARTRVLFKDIAQMDGDATEDERMIVAYHEAGHAFMSLFYNKPILQASILRQGESAGHVEMERNYPLSYSDKLARRDIQIALAGDIATTEAFHEHYWGAKEDISHAFAIAEELIANGGVGYLFGNTKEGPFAEKSEELTKKEGEILTEEADIARKVIVENMPIIERIAYALIERNSLSGNEIRRLMIS